MNKLIKRMLAVLMCILIVISIANISNAADDNGDIVIGLDPGHGGNDSGAVGGGLYEKDITWKIASRVKEILDATPGIRGVLTKSQYETLDSREERARRAVESGADLLVSFHINSNASSNSLSGAEVYVTCDTTQKRFYEYSNRLGLDILQNLRNIGVPSHSPKPIRKVGADWDVYPDGVIADYYGIISWPMHMGVPGVLIEHAFINNPYDRANYLNDAMINKMAEADAAAIIKNKELFRIDRTKNSVKGALDSVYYDSNTGSIKGKVLYNEVINDMSYDNEPIVNLVSTDGKVKIQGTVTKISSYTYSYDINIMDIDPYREYVLQVETKKETSYIPNNRTLNLTLPDGRLGTIYGMEIDVVNGSMKFNVPAYDGYLNTYPFSDMTVNGNKLEGKLVVQEFLNGVTQQEPKTNPKVMLVAEDGSKIQCEVSYVEPYVYGFSCENKYIDKTKKYEIYVQSGTDKNISSHREMKVEYTDKQIGILDVYTVSIVNGKLQFIYDGYMTSRQYTDVTLNGNIISGKLIVQEWLNGTVQIEPTSIPKLVLKNSNNSLVKEVTMEYVEPYVYSYSIDISDISDISVGEYTFEVQGTNENNISTHQNIEIALKAQEIGNIGNNEIKVANGKLLIGQLSNEYDGYMLSSQYTDIALNGNTINGKLVVQEWLNGTVQIEPKTLPKLVMKNDSGIVKELTMEYVEPYVYSYSIDISDISVGEYIFEVQGTNKNNISAHQNIEISLENQEIGNLDDKVLRAENGKLVVKVVDNTYDGYMLSSQYTDVALKGSKISGKLVVQEWLNGTVQIEPKTLPKLVIKNGSKVEKEITMDYEEPYVYSYSFDISDLNVGEYIFEVQGTNKDNISEHQNIEISLENQEIGNLGDKVLSVENGKLVIKTVDNTYDGYMLSMQYTDVVLNGNTISGKLVVQEWLNGTVQIEPKTLPKLVIKNGSEIVKEITMNYEEPYVYSYSFDISDLSVGEYIFEVQGTNKDNISNHQNIEVILKEQEVGKILDKEIEIVNGKLSVENSVDEIKEKQVQEESTVVIEKQNEIITDNNNEVEEDVLQQKNNVVEDISNEIK